MRNLCSRHVLKQGLFDVFDFDFNASEPRGQFIVDRGENGKEDKTDKGHENRHEKVNGAHDGQLLATENNHGNTNERVDEAHQGIERSDDLAGL